ncbi:hypothetical protein [Methylocella sp.]|uniref:hypothetical protein n=1 Tax=Methylocella sp. TaxID=1978226 RepID=UPI003782E2DA
MRAHADFDASMRVDERQTMRVDAVEFEKEMAADERAACAERRLKTEEDGSRGAAFNRQETPSPFVDKRQKLRPERIGRHAQVAVDVAERAERVAVWPVEQAAGNFDRGGEGRRKPHDMWISGADLNGNGPGCENGRSETDAVRVRHENLSGLLRGGGELTADEQCPRLALNVAAESAEACAARRRLLS